MSAVPSYLDRKNLGGSRSGISQAQGTPGSPHTPRRNPPSTYSSPGTGLRSDEEFVVIEIGSRHISAGFAGECYPKCTLGFSQEESRRVGDYRRWLQGHSAPRTLTTKSSVWGQGNELWRMDLNDVDLGLVEDKLERAIRDAYSRVLLQDSKGRRVVLALPSILPQSLLASVISILFRNFQVPGLVLLPIPTVSVLGAGQRSGLVVDIGWHETIVTAVYEFREIKYGRTTRGMRRITLAMARLIDQASKRQPLDLKPSDEDPLVQYDFEFAEEVTTRLAWCSLNTRGERDVPSMTDTRQKVEALSDRSHGVGDNAHSSTLSETLIRLPKGANDHALVKVQFQDFSLPTESVLFPDATFQCTLDDEEHTVHTLIYEVLIGLSPDVRAICASNIIFIGGGSEVPGLKTRLVDELSHLVEVRGWDPIWGKAVNKHRERLKEIDRNRQSKAANDVEKAGEIDSGGKEEQYEGPPAFQEPEDDPISQKLREAAAKMAIEQPIGDLRCIESLGPWAGASMAASLKLKGAVEIERETYLQQGMAGAHREHETNTNVAKSRQSMGTNLARTTAGDSSAWTLGLWGV